MSPIAQRAFEARQSRYPTERPRPGLCPASVVELRVPLDRQRFDGDALRWPAVPNVAKRLPGRISATARAFTSSADSAASATSYSSTTRSRTV